MLTLNVFYHCTILQNLYNLFTRNLTKPVKNIYLILSLYHYTKRVAQEIWPDL